MEEEERAMGVTPVLGTGRWMGREDTHLSSLLSRLSRFTHVAFGTLKANKKVN